MLYVQAFKTDESGKRRECVFIGSIGADENGNAGDMTYQEWGKTREELRAFYGDRVEFSTTPRDPWKD